ncbi:hypothetical protein C9374_011077 [Naegleria lovaniensis]|uniref:F-box domain-containing protein n=1 Tax=Naegleria lovaniensis TaxID=51637 RepID=A0AA88KCX5_NAELO|nr:uncharacterized protein C9374_011077 [Naegleria lovaniensis]KAG2374240.1 hypothetical protein C9374_011077 [Naegleria lovaniensis]
MCALHNLEESAHRREHKEETPPTTSSTRNMKKEHDTTRKELMRNTPTIENVENTTTELSEKLSHVLHASNKAADDSQCNPEQTWDAYHLHLPPEILAKIFSYVACEPIFLYCFSSLPNVCKVFRRVLQRGLGYHDDEATDKKDQEIELSFSTNIKSSFQHNLIVDWLNFPLLQKVINSKRLETIFQNTSRISCLDLSNQRSMFQSLLSKNLLDDFLLLIENLYLKCNNIKRIYLCGCFSIEESKEMTTFTIKLINLHRKYSKESCDSCYIDVSPHFLPSILSNEATEYLSYNLAVIELQNEFPDVQVVDWYDLLFNPIETDLEFLERIKSVDSVNIPHVNVRGWSLLHSAILNGYYRSVQYLLSLPHVNVDICSNASFSNDETLKVPTPEDEDESPKTHKSIPSLEFRLKYKGTPLFFAMYRYATSDKSISGNKDMEVMDMLLHRGASYNITDNYRRSFLLIAISYNFPLTFINYILDHCNQIFMCDSKHNNVLHQLFFSPALIKDVLKTRKLMETIFSLAPSLFYQCNSANHLPIQIPFVFNNFKNFLSKECGVELVRAISHFIECTKKYGGVDMANTFIEMAIEDCLKIINDGKLSKKKTLVVINKIFIELLDMKIKVSLIDPEDVNAIRNECMRLDETGVNILHRMKKADCVKAFFKYLGLEKVSYYFYINTPDSNGNTLLHHLIAESESEFQIGNESDRIVEELQGDVTYRNKVGETPLSLAAKRGYYSCVHFMLSNQQTSHVSEKQIIDHNDNILCILRSSRNDTPKDRRPCYSITSCIKLIQTQNEMLIQNLRHPKDFDHVYDEILKGDSYSDETSSSTSSSRTSSQLSLMDMIKLSEEKKESKKQSQKAAKRKKKKDAKQKDFEYLDSVLCKTPRYMCVEENFNNGEHDALLVVCEKTCSGDTRSVIKFSVEKALQGSPSNKNCLEEMCERTQDKFENCNVLEGLAFLHSTGQVYVCDSRGESIHVLKLDNGEYIQEIEIDPIQQQDTSWYTNA